MSWKTFRETMMIVIGIALLVFLVRLDHDVDRNYGTGLKTRAEDCRLQRGLGIPLTDNCMDDDLKDVFDPNEKIQTGSMRLLCDALHRADPEYVLPEGCPDA